MWKKIAVVAGGMALAVALPFVALAVTTDEFSEVPTPANAATEAVQVAAQVQATPEVPAAEPTGPWVSPNAALDPVALQAGEQTMVRQQLRVHAETGPPEGFEPVQQRLHVDDPLGMGPGPDHQGRAQHMGDGNPDAPMAGVGTGNPEDCPHEGQVGEGQMGEGQMGSQGAGKAGRGGRNG